MRAAFLGDVVFTEDATFSFPYVDAGTPVTDSFESGFTTWVNVAGDQRDFTRQSGPTTTSSTGPNAAHDGSWYVYAETSSPAITNDLYWLQTAAAFVPAPGSDLTFYYHMYGATIGTTNVRVSTDSGSSWSTPLWTVTGQQQTGGADPWTLATVSLAAYAGQSILVRIEYQRGTSFTGDAAFDLITYTPAAPYDVTINAGSWFASALHVWLYVLSTVNTAMSTSYAVTLDADTGVLTFTGSPTVDVPDVPGLGFAAGSATLTTSAALDGVFSPEWPIVSLTYGVENLTGYSTVAQDGTPYSLAGAWQESCSLTVAINRAGGAWQEYQAWLYLWHTYWLRGRFVTLYIDEDDLPTTATGFITPGIILQYAQGALDTKPVHMFNRLVENINTRDLTDNIGFSIKRRNTAAWVLR
jgi:hypothetical protein